MCIQTLITPCLFVFDNDEEKVFDVKPYLDKGIFSQLKDRRIFNSVKPFLGSIQWVNGLDFCPDTLYLEGKPCDRSVGKT
jgi:hypothetical protein